MAQKKAKLLAYLEALGLGPKLDSFSDRIRAQKLVYLLKQHDPEISMGYSWYIHGPYSPQLTRVLFDESTDTKPSQLTPKEHANLDETRNFLEQDLYSPDGLELIVSLIYLCKNGRSLGLNSKDSIIGFLLEEKPHFSREDVDAAWKRISHSRAFAKFLPKE